MQKKLQHRLEKKNLLFFFFPFLLAVTPSVCLGQTVLKPGDLFIANISSGSAINFEFVPLISLEEGTTIHFTDNAYVSEKEALTQTEATLTFTAPETIPAGTVISYSQAEQDFEGPEPEADGLGDNLLVYQATNSGITFIYGIEWGSDSPSWTYNTNAAGSHSDMPPGLSKDDHTIVSLGEGEYHWYDTDNGLEGSPKTLIRLVGNSANWRSGKAERSAYDTAFSVLRSPMLRLSANDSNISADEETIRVSVELVESVQEPVSAQVVFMDDSSTVSGEDIGNYSIQTVHFTAGDAAGTTKTIAINIPDSVTFTESRTAVFNLQSSTNGSVAMPQRIKVILEADGRPGREIEKTDVIITEVNAKPGDDADGNGVTDRSDDEFVEFVNNGSTDIDISGWTFSDDGSTVRHVFPAGTVVPASGALVLFANEEVKPQGSFGGAIVQNSNQSETLSLDDRGDVPTLKDARGNVVTSFAYGEDTGDVMVRNKLSTGGGGYNKLAKVAEGYEQAFSTPGVQADGSTYGPKHRIDIKSGGWRVLASPEQNLRLQDLLKGFRIQGIGGSDAPAEEASIYYWDESSGGTITQPDNVSDIMESGRGYMIYFFGNDETKATESPGEISNTIAINKTHNNSTVSIEVSATDANENSVIDQNEGYNLLGNPFGTNISVTAVLDALEKVDNSLNRNVLVWDPAGGKGNGAYRSLTDGDFIAPFQAFFVRFMNEVSGNVVLNHIDILAGKVKQRHDKDNKEIFGFEITLDDGSVSDAYQLIFREEGDVGPDKLDAYKLFSLNPGSLNLFSREGTVRLMKNVLPADLNTALEVPLLFELTEDKKTFEFSWEGIGLLPDGWDIRLVDQELDKEINLQKSTGYEFSVVPRRSSASRVEEGRKALIHEQATNSSDPRFVLMISPGQGLNTDKNELSEAAKLNPNYPNPFNSITRIPFELVKEAEVELSIWNIVGQKVATLIDEVREAGSDEVIWNAADLPSGIYIAQMEVGGNVYIRKMTLIKY